MTDIHEPHFQFVCPRLPVADLRRTIDFYTLVLSFKVAVLWPEDEPAFSILERGGVRLAFDRAPEAIAPKASSTGFYIETDDVRAVYESVRRRVAIEWGPEVYPYGRREFAILDPDRYMIIFSEPTDDPPTCTPE